MLTLPGAMAGSTGVITAVGCALLLGGLAGYTYALWGRACHATGGKTPVECCRTLRLPLCVQLSAPSAGDALRMVSVMLYAVKVNGASHSWKWLRFFWAVPSTLVKGRQTGRFQTGGFPDLDLSFLFCPFLGLSRFFRDFPDLLGDGPGIFPICPFPLSQPIKSTYEEQSRKGPRHNLDLSRKKVGNTRVWKHPGLASLKLVAMPSAHGKENRLVSCYSNSSPLWLRLKQSLAMVVALPWCPQSETRRRRFRRARFQTTNSVSFLVLTEFQGENSVSSSQPIICVPKRTHRVFRRTHRVCR